METPGQRTIDEVTRFLSVRPGQLVKTLIFRRTRGVVAALIRGDHELNEAKLKSLLGATRSSLPTRAWFAQVTGAPMGFAGPVGLKIRIVADHAVRDMGNSITGGNERTFI